MSTRIFCMFISAAMLLMGIITFMLVSYTCDKKWINYIHNSSNCVFTMNGQCFW